MPITQDRMEAMVKAALSAFNTFKGLRDEIAAQYERYYSSCIRREDDGKFTAEMALALIMERVNFYQPDPEGLLLIGKEMEHFKQTRHKNNKTRNLQRARRGNPLNPPDLAYLPLGVPQARPTSHQSPRRMGDAPSFVHDGPLYGLDAGLPTPDEREALKARLAGAGMLDAAGEARSTNTGKPKITRPDFDLDEAPVILGDISGLAGGEVDQPRVAECAPALGPVKDGLPVNTGDMGEVDPLTAHVPDGSGPLF